MRNNGIKHHPYHFSVEEPKRLENIDDNYEEFFTALQNFDKKVYYNNTPRKSKKCIKDVKRKNAKNQTSLSYQN